MRLLTIALAAGALFLGACDNATPQKQNPEALKGAEFITTQNGLDITLTFDPEEMRVHGKALNRYSGPYEAADNKITFGPFMTTMMAGLPDKMTAERDYFNFMAMVETYELKGNQLFLRDFDGDEIIFEKLTSESESKATSEEAKNIEDEEDCCDE